MGIGGLGPQDGVKIIEHDMTILITNLAIMGYGSCAFYKPLDLFFLKKNQFLVLATTSVQHGAGEEAHIQVLNEAGFFG